MVHGDTKQKKNPFVSFLSERRKTHKPAPLKGAATLYFYLHNCFFLNCSFVCSKKKPIGKDTTVSHKPEKKKKKKTERHVLIANLILGRFEFDFIYFKAKSKMSVAL